MAPSPSVSPSVSTSVHGPLALFLERFLAWKVGSPLLGLLPTTPPASPRRLLRRDAKTDWADSLRERAASRVRLIAALRSASACDQTVRQTPWYVTLPLPPLALPLTALLLEDPGVLPWPTLLGRPRNCAEPLRREYGSSLR